jgi:dynein heavy chain
LLTDAQIVDEKFMVYINDLLASGEISGLFPDDEIDNIVGALTNPFKNENPGQNVDKENIYKFFITRIKKNLHFSLCFSPVGDNLRVKARKFPALVNNTVINWFQKWPLEALRSVLLTRAGNLRALTLKLSPTGEKHREKCKFFLILVMKNL